jgi:serine protease Do
MRLRNRSIHLKVLLTLGVAVFGSLALTQLVDFGFLPFAHPVLAQDTDKATHSRVYQQAAPAVVSIETEAGAGSGTIISPDGLILTAAHIVGDAQIATVTLANGTKQQAEVVGFAEAGIDLAVLHIRGQQTLPIIPIARSESLSVGQPVFVIGNPLGQFAGNFTEGTISRIDPNRGLIQTDAAINPSNGGGPLLDANGQLVGVIVATFEPAQTAGNNRIGFAISVRQIKVLLDAVREGRAPRTAQDSFARNAQPIRLDGEWIEGDLNPTSNLLPSDNSYYNGYTFEGKAGEQVSIDMSSRDFDAYLILLTPNGRSTIKDDDSGGGTDAKITTTLPENGTYLILANSASPRAGGHYRLRVLIPSQ